MKIDDNSAMPSVIKIVQLVKEKNEGVTLDSFQDVMVELIEFYGDAKVLGNMIRLRCGCSEGAMQSAQTRRYRP